MKIVLAHSGKQHSYNVAKAMKNLGVLQKFYTSSYVSSAIIQKKWGNNSWLQRRFIDGIYGKDVNVNWRFEVKEQVTRLLTRDTLKFREAVYERDKAFDHYMSRRIQGINSDLFWGFQGSCFETLDTARASGKQTVCELATAHVTEAKKILAEESILHPEWAHTIDNFSFPTWYEQRLMEEPLKADWVIAASGFTKQSLLNSGISDKKIKLLPLGFDASDISFNKDSLIKSGKRPLRLLYAGRVTQRKGIKYLLEAMCKFDKKDVKLHIIGQPNNAEKQLKSYEDCFTLHNPLSQKELFKIYCEYDALVLPSVFEGFGLVIVEAMAAGLPVITTPNTFGPEIIEDDKNGYIVPIRSSMAIEKVVEKLLEKTTDELNEMKCYARETALRFSWDTYQTRLLELLNDF